MLDQSRRSSSQAEIMAVKSGATISSSDTAISENMSASSEQQSTSQPVSFMTLPSEIRMAVYEHFFSGQPRLISYPSIRPFDLVDKRHWQLLLVSMSVYREALPVYYRSCIFGLYELNHAHLQRFLKDITDTHFSHSVSNLFVWRLPDQAIFETLHKVRWVKMVGITCGVEPDVSNGQIFTHNSLMASLHKARVPGFTWERCLDLCRRYSKIDFMVDFRCDYPEKKLGADGTPRMMWIKTNFVYNVRTDTFVEETRHSRKQEALVLRR